MSDSPTLWDAVATDHERLMASSALSPNVPLERDRQERSIIQAARQDSTIQERFEMFHRTNPDVYVAFVRLAREYQDRGYPRVGIGHLTEILRWQRRMRTYDPTTEFKISNDYRSRYARLIMEREPDLDGFITTRELRSA